MILCLVCHTEPDVWDGGFSSIDTVLPPLLELLDSVTDARCNTPRVAWCLTAQMMRHRTSVFGHLVGRGHEIGVHSHYPAASGPLEHAQALNEANLGAFERWFPDLCSLALRVGLPQPRTHASWMFAYRDGMTRTLGESGIHIDCSVCYGGTHSLPNGFLLADSRGRTSGKPYRLSERDHCVTGTSSVIELPVGGGFGDYWEADRRGHFVHFSPIRSDEGVARQLRLFSARLADLAPGDVDVFHMHFHLYEFLRPGGLSRVRLGRARAMLKAMVADDRVRFATPTEAVDAWLNSEG